jgi:hypothetical protein
LLNGLLFKPAHNFPMIKHSMIYVKLFHRLNSQEFQTVNQLKKRGKFWKQHMRAQKLLNPLSSKC